MQKILIKGGRRLNGTIRVQGAKNSVLPILAASLLTDGSSIIHNCPNITDVDCSLRILKELGCRTVYERSTIIVDSSSMDSYEIPDSLMREMRSSIVFLGAILSRFNKAKLSFPGGCCLGSRPIDMHLSALESMGVDITEQHGFIECNAKDGLHGAQISLAFPSVGATENIMLAAALAKGKTVIFNAAREPEICDLADYLIKCGAKIIGAGSGTVTIDGVDMLHGAEHTVIPDRIAAMTYMAAAAATHGDVQLEKIDIDHMMPVLPYFSRAGCELVCENNRLRICADRRLDSFGTVRTMPYPGFPTDAQAPLTAVAAQVNGTSIIIETVFENRFKHIGELMRMGANIKTEGRVAVVEGVDRLWGAPVQAEDLRAAAALVIAGLSADGVTEISGIQYLDRGYEKIEDILCTLGAEIKRIEE